MPANLSPNLADIAAQAMKRYPRRYNNMGEYLHEERRRVKHHRTRANGVRSVAKGHHGGLDRM
uniref:Uncharacterized protein n=1 Tax=Bionectria ochroleuca TaxID=29856 RepID=A0A8H7KDT5_BIOOC